MAASSASRGWCSSPAPGTASGVVFITLEDETGAANLIIWSSIYDRYHRAARYATLLQANGHHPARRPGHPRPRLRLIDRTELLEGSIAVIKGFSLIIRRSGFIPLHSQIVPHPDTDPASRAGHTALGAPPLFAVDPTFAGSQVPKTCRDSGKINSQYGNTRSETPIACHGNEFNPNPAGEFFPSRAGQVRAS